jgi:NADP-dependent 3-hydroxy acid dehydrogenase YdfG
MASDDQAVLQGIERLNARLERMEGRMSGMEGRLSSMENRMSTIEFVVADMDGRLKSWPDMHFLTAAAKAQMAHTRELKSDVADIKVRMVEIYQAMATDPEIRSLREEVGRFRDQSVALDVRVGTIEGHLGVDSSLTPP